MSDPQLKDFGAKFNQEDNSPKALDNINFWVGGLNLGTVHGKKQPSPYFLRDPWPPRTQIHLQKCHLPFLALLAAATSFVGKIAPFQLHAQNVSAHGL